MKDFTLLLVGVAIVGGSFYLFLTKPAPARYQSVPENVQEPWKGQDSLMIGEALIQFEVADAPDEISLGLSGRESLEASHGLLFIMPTSAKHGFWMKNMNFPIDIIWIDESWIVAGVERNAPPESHPQIFAPERPIKYVLEVPAGTVDELGIDTGEKVYFGYGN